MATTTEGKIEDLLMTRANECAVALGLPILPFAVKHETVPNRFLSSKHIPNVVERLQIDSSGHHNYIGMLQVTVHWELYRGAVEPMDAVGGVVGYFPCDLVLNDGEVAVRIMKKPEVGPAITDDTHLSYPVTIEYQCYS